MAVLYSTYTKILYVFWIPSDWLHTMRLIFPESCELFELSWLELTRGLKGIVLGLSLDVELVVYAEKFPQRHLFHSSAVCVWKGRYKW